MAQALIIWIILLIIPLFPVISLYTLFSEKNFFGLDGFFKSIVATGPIAAYLGVVWIGWNIYSGVSKRKISENKLIQTITPSIDIANQLVGKWDFVSTSSHERKLTGKTTIRIKNGILRVNGEFYENGTPIGIFDTPSAQVVNDNTFVIIYNFQEHKNGVRQIHQGVCTFSLGDIPINKMTGFWVVVGRTDMFGITEYTKREKKS